MSKHNTVSILKIYLSIVETQNFASLQKCPQAREHHTFDNLRTRIPSLFVVGAGRRPALFFWATASITYSNAVAVSTLLLRLKGDVSGGLKSSATLWIEDVAATFRSPYNIREINLQPKNNDVGLVPRTSTFI